MTYTYSSTPAQWSDDWLTPAERRALRAEDRMAALSKPTPAKPLSVQPRAIPTRSKLSRVVQRVCQAVAWSAIALSIVGLWYIACVIAATWSAH